MAIRPIPQLHRSLADLPGTLGAHSAGVTVGGRLAPGMAYATTLLGIQGRMYLMPVYVPKRVLISHLATRVSVVGTAGAVVRLGLYRGRFDTVSSGLGEPWNDPVIDAGTVATDDATGDKLAIAGVTLPEALYWIAVVPQGAPATQATFLATADPHPLINASATTPTTAGARGSGIFSGALPSISGTGGREAVAPFAGLEIQAWGG